MYWMMEWKMEWRVIPKGLPLLLSKNIMSVEKRPQEHNNTQKVGD